MKSAMMISPKSPARRLGPGAIFTSGKSVFLRYSECVRPCASGHEGQISVCNVMLAKVLRHADRT